MGHVYSGEKFECATSSEQLDLRLKLNKAYASADFDGWLLDRLAVKEGEDILDVGCGNGAQSIPLAALVGPAGSVSALDISDDSIRMLCSKVGGMNVEAITADMADLRRIIAEVFRVKRYDLAHSSYALYYAQERTEVLDAMKRALKPGGRLAVFTPIGPHGLVELAARIGPVPQPVFDSLDFGPDVLRPWFRGAFDQVDEHLFHNVISMPNEDEVIAFYRATTYYIAAAEPAIRDEVAGAIARDGAFKYEKNGFLIIGQRAR